MLISQYDSNSYNLILMTVVKFQIESHELIIYSTNQRSISTLLSFVCILYKCIGEEDSRCHRDRHSDNILRHSSI